MRAWPRDPGLGPQSSRLRRCEGGHRAVLVETRLGPSPFVLEWNPDQEGGMVRTSKVINVIIVDPDPSLRDRWRAAFRKGSGFRITGEGARVLDAYTDTAALEARANGLLINADHIDRADTRTGALL